MSIVNKQTLDEIKRQRDKAKQSGNWEDSYQFSIRGLDAAIALIEQIDHTTKDLVFETKLTLRKD